MAKAFHLSARSRWMTSLPIMSKCSAVLPFITVIRAES